MADKDKNDSKDDQKAAEKGAEQVQEVVDAEEEKGFRGTEADTTPNENYTVAGVTAGKPVPEAASNPAIARRKAHSDDTGDSDA
jgi:hypothetical protein